MSQAPVVTAASTVNDRAMPPMTWNGTLIDASETMTHFLHLSAFPCEKCNGPVIAGSLGTRLDGISQETDLQKIGAVCIVCSFRPEMTMEPSVGHWFRPVEWQWAIKPQPARAIPVSDTSAADDQLSTELSQDADSMP